MGANTSNSSTTHGRRLGVGVGAFVRSKKNPHSHKPLVVTVSRVRSLNYICQQHQIAKRSNSGIAKLPVTSTEIFTHSLINNLCSHVFPFAHNCTLCLMGKQRFPGARTKHNKRNLHLMFAKILSKYMVCF